MGFLKNVFGFVRSPTHSRTTAVIVLFLILAAIPLTVIVSQQQQQLRQRAASQDACSNISNIQACSTNFQAFPCISKGQQCKDNNIVYECKEQ